jgi:hypothetical protein
LIDKSIERVLKSFIEERTLVKLLNILEEGNIRSEDIKNTKIKSIDRRPIDRISIDGNISNRFYN